MVTFLSEFDAVFTLNQDLMLELHYHPGNTVEPRKRWRASVYPGIELPSTWLEVPRVDRLQFSLSPDARKTAYDPRDQPIYKLHGSVNWRTSDGSAMMVIGDGKEASIRGNTLLAGYFEKFRECLSSGDARLMVIGYSFSDPHVNDLVEDASLHANLQTYLVNPVGLSVFDNPHPGSLGYVPKAVFAALKPVGISTRPFRDAFTSDDLSFKSFQRFLSGP